MDQIKTILEEDDYLANDCVRILNNDQQYYQSDEYNQNIYIILNRLYQVQEKYANVQYQLNQIHDNKIEFRQYIIQQLLQLSKISQLDENYMENMFTIVGIYNLPDLTIYFQQLMILYDQFEQSIMMINLIRDQNFVQFCQKNIRGTPRVFQKFNNLIKFLTLQFFNHQNMRINLLEVITKICFRMDSLCRSLGDVTEDQQQTIEQYNRKSFTLSFQEQIQKMQQKYSQLNQQLTGQQLSELQTFFNQYPQAEVYAQNQICIVLDHLIYVCIQFIRNSDDDYILNTYQQDFIETIYNVQTKYCQYILLQLCTQEDVQYMILQKLFIAAFGNPTTSLSVCQTCAQYFAGIMSFFTEIPEDKYELLMSILRNIIEKRLQFANIRDPQMPEFQLIISLKAFLFCLKNIKSQYSKSNEDIDAILNILYNEKYNTIFTFCFDELKALLDDLYFSDEQQYNEINSIVTKLRANQRHLSQTMQYTTFYMEYSKYQLAIQQVI